MKLSSVAKYLSVIANLRPGLFFNPGSLQLWDQVHIFGRQLWRHQHKVSNGGFILCILFSNQVVAIYPPLASAEPQYGLN